MTETDGYRIPRHEQRTLAELLYPPHNSKAWAAGIPALIEDLAIAITRQDRITSGPRVASGDTTQPLPINLAASDIADELHTELTHLAEHTCESRGMYFWRLEPGAVRYDFIGPLQLGQQRHAPREPSTIELARWLARNIIALALSPNTQHAPARVEAIVARARRIIDRPAEADQWADPDRVDQARALWLNQTRIIDLAPQLDDRYRNLTARRFRTLVNAGTVQPIACLVAGQLDLYVVGDVLDAHLRHPIRRTA